ncbi:MAG TPA: hypothetical protein ENF47_03025 [Thermoprotei archaeon]|nr:hypothetical protein [Thermoprotei archaeon]
MEYHIDREIRERRVSIWEIDEFDKWVNDATIKDIRDIVKKYNVFGLRIWEYKIINRDELPKYAHPFGVDLIFLEKNKDEVLKIIEMHKRGEIDDMTYLSKLYTISFYSCTWV